MLDSKSARVRIPYHHRDAVTRHVMSSTDLSEFLNDWKASAAVKIPQNYEAQSIEFCWNGCGATYS
ncbi:hypothetical protein AGR1A_pAt20304 [Agrobacterium fabacearum CFBP 5771]|nr:hypothetical protein AGR1A_pAt20304 [Agrobacterium fabacearum CFBP 5771]